MCSMFDQLLLTLFYDFFLVGCAVKWIKKLCGPKKNDEAKPKKKQFGYF